MRNIVAKLWIMCAWKICVTLELTLRAMLRLKLVLQLLFVLEMSRIVKAVTFAFYEDTKCTTLVASPFQGVPNPLVAPLNVCTKTFQVNSMPSYFHQWPNNNLIPHNLQDGPTSFYIKPTQCSSTYPHPIYTYSNAACTQTHLEPHTFHIGACVTQGAPPGCASFMITCSHAATAWTSLGVSTLALLYISM